MERGGGGERERKRERERERKHTVHENVTDYGWNSMTWGEEMPRPDSPHSKMAAAATCVREPCMVSGDGEHVYQETPSAYTWIGKVHSPSNTVQFWSSENNSKMAAVSCCYHVWVGEWRHGVMHLMMEIWALPYHGTTDVCWLLYTYREKRTFEREIN